MLSFIATLMATLEYGMEDAPTTCKSCMASWRTELEAVGTQMTNFFLPNNGPVLAGYPELLKKTCSTQETNI